MTDKERSQMASDTLCDMNLAIERKWRVYNRYVKHGALNAAAELAQEIADMEAELEYEETIFRIAFY